MHSYLQDLSENITPLPPKKNYIRINQNDLGGPMRNKNALNAQRSTCLAMGYFDRIDVSAANLMVQKVCVRNLRSLVLYV